MELNTATASVGENNDGEIKNYNTATDINNCTTVAVFDMINEDSAVYNQFDATLDHVNRKNKEFQELEMQYYNSQKNNEALLLQNEELQRTINDKDCQLFDLKEQLAKLNDLYEFSQTELRVYQKQVKEKNDAIDKLNDTINSLNDTISNLNIKLKDTEQALAETHESLAANTTNTEKNSTNNITEENNDQENNNQDSNEQSDSDSDDDDNDSNASTSPAAKRKRRHSDCTTENDDAEQNDGEQLRVEISELKAEIIDMKEKAEKKDKFLAKLVENYNQTRDGAVVFKQKYENLKKELQNVESYWCTMVTKLTQNCKCKKTPST